MSRRRTGPAPRAAAYCAAVVVGLSLPFAAHAYFSHRDQCMAQLERDAGAALTLTSTAMAREDSEYLLRSAYQSEAGRRGIDHLAMVVGNRVAIAHPMDWEGFEPSRFLGVEAGQGLPHDGTGHPQVRHNETSDRYEVVLPLTPAGSSPAAWLYVARDAAAVRVEARGQAFQCIKLGALLALCGGTVTYLCLKKELVNPLQKLTRRISNFGLGTELDVTGLGELGDLAEALQTATRKLLSQEEHRITGMEAERDQAREASAVQTEVIQQLVKDLRSAMSAILGHAELLMARESNPADRINYIRNIQKEARRISQLVRELQELIPERSAQLGPGDDALPLARLRLIVERLSGGRTTTLQLGRSQRRRRGGTAAETGPAVGHGSDAGGPEVKTRLSGSVLFLGRKDEVASGLLNELHELGLDAVLVPDLPALQNEIKRGDYDLTLASMSRGSRSAEELVARLRALLPEHPVVAVLPDAARGEGNRYVSLGYDDYLYAPATRRNLLTVIGKYIGFKPIR